MKFSMIIGALGTAFGIAATPPTYHYIKGNLTPRPVPGDLSPDAIMVFTGAADRIAEGYKLYADGIANNLMISGIDYESYSSHPVVAALSQEALQANIHIDLLAKNTIENARNSAQWAKEYQIKSILLITSDYHIDRAYFELRRLLPADTELFVKAIPGIGSGKAIDSETNRLLCRMYETFIGGSFCYPVRNALRELELA